MNAVLIIDRDLGFVFWLGGVLHRAGYVAVPATNYEDAAELLKLRKAPIQLLVADGTLPGAGAFIENLRGTNPPLKVIGLSGEAAAPGTQFAGADAVHERTCAGRASEMDWMEAIEGVLARARAKTPE